MKVWSSFNCFIIDLNSDSTLTNDPFFEPFFHPFFNHQKSYKVKNLGSGVIISDDGFIITNSHVVENATDITITLVGGKRYEGQIIGIDHLTDLALIKIGNNSGTPLSLKSPAVDIGQKIFAIGKCVIKEK